jgi:hypothetical protein
MGQLFTGAWPPLGGSLDIKNRDATGMTARGVGELQRTTTTSFVDQVQALAYVQRAEQLGQVGCDPESTWPAAADALGGRLLVLA